LVQKNLDTAFINNGGDTFYKENPKKERKYNMVLSHYLADPKQRMKIAIGSSTTEISEETGECHLLHRQDIVTWDEARGKRRLGTTGRPSHRHAGLEVEQLMPAKKKMIRR
jgi:hypothetical protein